MPRLRFFCNRNLLALILERYDLRGDGITDVVVGLFGFNIGLRFYFNANPHENGTLPYEPFDWRFILPFPEIRLDSQ